jgi:predicted nucleic acid-binding protein
MIVLDAGPLIALFDGTDRYHAAAVDFIRRTRQPLVTNPPVLAEACWVLDFSVDAQLDCLRWASQALRIDDQTGRDLPRITAILDKYRDLPADFADASLVALCERLNCYDVASVDSEFTIYRSASRRAFRNRFPA